MPAFALFDSVPETLGSDLDIDLRVVDLDLPGDTISVAESFTHGSECSPTGCCPSSGTGPGASVSTLHAAAMCLLC
ncbi:MAG: hypothetical protein HOY76_31465 [Streptomyces sp.]|nr:hypothetical protein [Streptomyces sp.]